MDTYNFYLEKKITIHIFHISGYKQTVIFFIRFTQQNNDTHKQILNKQIILPDSTRK